MKPHMHPMRVTQLQVLHNYVVRFTFTDDSVRDIDLDEYVHGPAFAPVRDPAYFRQAVVACGTISWPNGADIDPNVLYYGLIPASEEHTI